MTLVVIEHPERVRWLRPLPPRQRQVLELWRAGYGVHQTAKKLGIAPGTVKVYRARLRSQGRAAS